MIRQLSGFPSMFDEFHRMRDDANGLFEPWGRPVSIRSPERRAFPMVNVGTDANTVHVYVLAPGVTSNKFEVSLQDNVLTIGGERSAETPEQGLHLNERYNGPFKRTITLPDDIDAEHIDAVYQNGVLHIRIARREETKPRRIEVK